MSWCEYAEEYVVVVGADVLLQRFALHGREAEEEIVI